MAPSLEGQEPGFFRTVPGSIRDVSSFKRDHLGCSNNTSKGFYPETNMACLEGEGLRYPILNARKVYETWRVKIGQYFEPFKDLFHETRLYLRDDSSVQGWIFVNFLAMVFILPKDLSSPLRLGLGTSILI